MTDPRAQALLDAADRMEFVRNLYRRWDEAEAAQWSLVAAWVRSHADMPTEDELASRRAASSGRRDYPGREGGAYGVNFFTGQWLRAPIDGAA